MPNILAATYWPNNAAMVEALVKLEYLHSGMSMLDATFGKGGWWRSWKPDELIKHDLAIDGVDFRNLPYPDDTFDGVAFDPPYVSVGGRATTTIREMYDSYGMDGAPTSPKLMQKLINDGLKEQARVVKPTGIIICKCMDYVSSGKLWPGVYLTTKAALKLGLAVEDHLLYIRKSSGPQPGNRTKKLKSGEVVASRQHHARRNVSNLLVLRAPVA